MSFLSGLIGLIGLLVVLVTVAGLISPRLLKDKETGEVPKRTPLLAGGAALAIVAFALSAWVAPDATPPVPPLPDKPAPKQEAPAQGITQPAAEPMNLEDARALAKRTLQLINDAEQSLANGIAIEDGAGIIKHVSTPLDEEVERWRIEFGTYNDDQRTHFWSCHNAAMKLLLLSRNILQPATTQRMKEQRSYRTEFPKAKQQCEKEIATTDAQIKAAVAAGEARLKEKYGGSDCLTVYAIDPEKGYAVPQPKPAHCKG